MSYETLIIEPGEGFTLIRFNRPDALNAFNAKLMTELADALTKAEKDPAVRCMIITGSEKAFAAGADIKEMANLSYADAYTQDFITSTWEAVLKCRKPVIAAVAGFCLGGGCELAMMCDFILAADTARFGQPEINIGVFPGAGGSQRLTRFVGKSKAMEMVLTARMMDAAEAERAGLVSRVIPAAELVEEAKKVAMKIAAFSPIAVMMGKEAVNAAYETSLSQGVMFESRLFQSTFALEDQKEGMTAFVEKRKPVFKGR
jgi:enoyl-CoA hydratase/carnithine racemase